MKEEKLFRSKFKNDVSVLTEGFTDRDATPPKYEEALGREKKRNEKLRGN